MLSSYYRGDIHHLEIMRIKEAPWLCTTDPLICMMPSFVALECDMTATRCYRHLCSKVKERKTRESTISDKQNRFFPHKLSVLHFNKINSSCFNEGPNNLSLSTWITMLPYILFSKIPHVQPRCSGSSVEAARAPEDEQPLSAWLKRLHLRSVSAFIIHKDMLWQVFRVLLWIWYQTLHVWLWNEKGRSLICVFVCFYKSAFYLMVKWAIKVSVNVWNM